MNDYPHKTSRRGFRLAVETKLAHQSCSTITRSLLVILGLAAFGCGGSESDELFYEQTQACVAYLDCAALVVPAELGELLDAFGPEGSCWTQGEDVGLLCDRACATGLSQVRALHDTNCEG